MKKSMIGKQVIVRSNMAGVFFGTLISKEGNEVTLENARKLYKWSGANTIEDIADKGVNNPEDCKFTVVVKEITIFDVCQIIPCTANAIKNIKSVKEWKD